MPYYKKSFPKNLELPPEIKLAILDKKFNTLATEKPESILEAYKNIITVHLEIYYVLINYDVMLKRQISRLPLHIIWSFG